ncbi:hypothetical protein E2I00_019254, partial [Balaenoptera physalus]
GQSSSASRRVHQHQHPTHGPDHGYLLVGPGNVDKQETAAESLSNLLLKEDKIKPDGAVVKTNANAEKTNEEEKEFRAVQSLLNKLIRSNLTDNTNQVEDLQQDPNSPLYSVKSFEELHLKPQLLQGVYTMGFICPSKIQENTLPLMLADPHRN